MDERRPLMDAVQVFPPSEEFSSRAQIKSMEEYRSLYNESINSPETFWPRIANELHWFAPWSTLLDDSSPPYYKWFVDGKTNISYNCLDRHLESKGNKVALIAESELGEVTRLTFLELFHATCKLANTLKSLGVRKQDKVAIYMPLIAEGVISMLACSRIGAVHNVIFAGFAEESIASRINDCSAKLVITSDILHRRGKALKLKEMIDGAIEHCPSVEKVLVFQRSADESCPMTSGRDFWFHEASAQQTDTAEAEAMDAEDMSFILYTSGTTGSPKGIVHTTGGYMVGAYLTTKYIFDIRDSDVYWCTADIGWITGHSYVVYGPLMNAATVFIYEGSPDYPDKGIFWELVAKFGVTIFYTAPTAIRTFSRWGDEFPQGHNLASLRLLGSVGEPLNPEAWMWYHRVIGQERCPIVDTWWQTETGGIMISPLPGATLAKPGSVTLPFFGVEPDVMNEDGSHSDYGWLGIKRPWPSMLRGIYGNDERFRECYWSKWSGKYYYTSDGAMLDPEGYFWIIGRLDDVVLVSGHNISTAELEGVTIEHVAVAESAFIGIKHEIKGNTLVGFVILKNGIEECDTIKDEISQLIGKKLGRFQVPERIVFVPEVPKTRSGKIMRRLLRDIAEGRDQGNTTTLADPSIIEVIAQKYRDS